MLLPSSERARLQTSTTTKGRFSGQGLETESSIAATRARGSRRFTKQASSHPLTVITTTRQLRLRGRSSVRISQGNRRARELRSMHLSGNGLAIAGAQQARRIFHSIFASKMTSTKHGNGAYLTTMNTNRLTWGMCQGARLFVEGYFSMGYTTVGMTMGLSTRGIRRGAMGYTTRSDGVH